MGDVSAELRRLLDYFIGLEIDREAVSGYERTYFHGKWERVAMDFHVLFLQKDADDYENSAYDLRNTLKAFTSRASIGPLFDLVEFFVRHKGCSAELKSELASAFIMAKSAYRIVDGQIIAIGVAEQGAAFEAALADAEASGAEAARKHLTAAGLALRNADWAGSVRESIHAVEAMALRLAPDASVLGPALIALERRGRLHGGLKNAFNSLYGYTSDEKGVRHALVLGNEARVDEADALFMLGACASFVSYLIARGTQEGDRTQGGDR
ncbi:hypothetical protein [Bosea vaviloviae]|nr:hypothetical protein [Bosea vaviloviae]